MFKNYELTLDIATGDARHPLIQVNTNDLDSFKISFIITQHKEPVDLTGKTIRIAILKPDRKTVLQDCTLTDAENGKGEVILDTQAYALGGKHYAEVMVYDGLEKVAVTGRFVYNANRGILNDGTVESTNEWQSINQAIADAEGILIDLRENGTGVDAQARQDLESVTAQLAQTTQYVNMKNNRSRFTAHRGAEGKAPENTMKAFEIAVDMGYDMIECDWQVTLDGHWVVMHDETVDRTTDGTGEIKNMTLEQVKELNIDSGNFLSRYPGLKVPLLEDVLKFAKKSGINIYFEIKSYNDDNDLVNLINTIDRYGMIENVWILSHYSIVEKMDFLNLNGRLAIFYDDSDGFKTAAKNNKVVAIAVYPMTSATPQLISELRSYGKVLTISTVRTMEDVKKFIDMGIDYISGDVSYV